MIQLRKVEREVGVCLLGLIRFNLAFSKPTHPNYRGVSEGHEWTFGVGFGNSPGPLSAGLSIWTRRPQGWDLIGLQPSRYRGYLSLMAWLGAWTPYIRFLRAPKGRAKVHDAGVEYL